MARVPGGGDFLNLAVRQQAAETELAQSCQITQIGAIALVAYVTALLTALSSEQADLRSLLPDAWITAHPEHFQKDRRDEAERVLPAAV